MRVSCDILEDLFWSGEGSLGVNHPIFFPARRDVAQEGISYPKWFEGGKELQVTGIESLPEIIEKQSTKQRRQDGNGQQVIGPAGNPSRSIWGNAAAWNDAMQVRMDGKNLAPGVEHCEESDLCAQMLGIRRDDTQRLAGSPEQSTSLFCRAMAATGCGTVKTT